MDKKISALLELLKAGIADTDMFAIVNAGQTKKISMATLFSKVDDAITDAFTAFQDSFGLLVLTASTTLPNTIGTAFSKIKISDAVGFDKSNGHIVYSFLNDNATVDADGIYEFSVYGSFTAPQNSIISFKRYKNDGAVGGVAPQFIGNGSTPVPIIGTITLELLAGDVIDVRAAADSEGVSLNIINLQHKLEKTHF